MPKMADVTLALRPATTAAVPKQNLLYNKKSGRHVTGTSFQKSDSEMAPSLLARQDTPAPPRKSPQAPDDPFAGLALIFMVSVASICVLFLLYRRASSLTYVVGNQLKTWVGPNEGRIRLSEDEGPSSQSFVVNDTVDSDEDEDLVNPNRQNQTAPVENHSAGR